MGLVLNKKGQGTLEAAFVVPVIFLLMLLLIQPGIVIYDRIIMKNAAAEGCRLLATSNDGLGSMKESCEAFLRHRLASIPQHDCFHVHAESCSWNINLIGDEMSREVSVEISNEIKPLPIMDIGSSLLGLLNEDGNLLIKETVTAAIQPEWVVSSSDGKSPDAWIGRWAE